MTKSRCKSKCAEGYVCGSFAFNLYKEGIDQGDLCDVHYWKAKALNDATHLAAPVQKEQAAISTLEALKYTYQGGLRWKPPLGKPPEYIENFLKEKTNDQ